MKIMSLRGISMKLKELKIMQLLTKVFNVLFTEEPISHRRQTSPAKASMTPKKKVRPVSDKKLGPKPYKRAKGNVSTDTTIFNHPRKDFHSN
jgi:hypothetical protein